MNTGMNGGPESPHLLVRAVSLAALAGCLANASHAQILEPGETFSDRLPDGSLGPEMVVIPAGSFRMGCVSGLGCNEEEMPVREVVIPNSFALARHEVTYGQWDACVDSGGCSYDPIPGNGRIPFRADRAVFAGWLDAQLFVMWLSSETGEDYRLPTEAEWEYAARAGSETQYGWGNELGRDRANCWECGLKMDDSKSVVGSFDANAFGLHDMHGSVWELVQDCWNENYDGAPLDGSAWKSGQCSMRVVRGGAINSGPNQLRSASRYHSPGACGLVTGFRVARTLNRNSESLKTATASQH